MLSYQTHRQHPWLEEASVSADLWHWSFVKADAEVRVDLIAGSYEEVAVESQQSYLWADIKVIT